jgi:hypothetical protein
MSVLETKLALSEQATRHANDKSSLLVQLATATTTTAVTEQERAVGQKVKDELAGKLARAEVAAELKRQAEVAAAELKRQAALV